MKNLNVGQIIPIEFVNRRVEGQWRPFPIVDDIPPVIWHEVPLSRKMYTEETLSSTLWLKLDYRIKRSILINSPAVIEKFSRISCFGCIPYIPSLIRSPTYAILGRCNPVIPHHVVVFLLRILHALVEDIPKEGIHVHCPIEGIRIKPFVADNIFR